MTEYPEWFKVLSQDPRWHGKDPVRYIKRIELTFPNINLDLESHSAYEWLQSPKGLKKKVLRGFWINWLKNSQPPVAKACQYCSGLGCKWCQDWKGGRQSPGEPTVQQLQDPTWRKANRMDE